MKKFLSLITIFLVCVLGACNGDSETIGSVKYMELNGTKKEYNQEVIDIINKTGENPVKLFISNQQQPKYVIKVGSDTYKIFQFPNEGYAIVEIKTDKVNNLYELSEKEYNKLVKILGEK